MVAIIIFSAVQPDALWQGDALVTDWQATQEVCACVSVCVRTPHGVQVTDWVIFD